MNSAIVSKVNSNFGSGGPSKQNGNISVSQNISARYSQINATAQNSVSNAARHVGKSFEGELIPKQILPASAHQKDYLKQNSNSNEAVVGQLVDPYCNR